MSSYMAEDEAARMEDEGEQQSPYLPPMGSFLMRQTRHGDDMASHDEVSTLTSVACAAVATSLPPSIANNTAQAEHITPASIVEVLDGADNRRFLHQAQPHNTTDNATDDAANPTIDAPIMVDGYHAHSVEEIIFRGDQGDSTIATLDNHETYREPGKCAARRVLLFLPILLLALTLLTLFYVGDFFEPSCVKTNTCQTPRNIPPEGTIPCADLAPILLNNFSKDELFQFALIDRTNETNRTDKQLPLFGDYCYIGVGYGSRYCRYYTYAKPSSTSSKYDGWPRNFRDEGTGCVSYNETFCWYVADEYNNWPMEERVEMCSGNETQNAAAQLLHAILNDGCGHCTIEQLVVLENWVAGNNKNNGTGRL